MSWNKWSYMDHWVTRTPQGPQAPSFNRAHMDNYIRQLASLGFTGFETFFFSIYKYAGMYGSIKAFERFLQDHGFEKIVSVFLAYPYATRFTAPHRPETHERIIADCVRTLDSVKDLSVENFIVMPTSTCFQIEPVTDEQIKVTADLWNRVGVLSKERGITTSCHFEFWGGIRTREQLDLFLEYTDPRFVSIIIDTAQHVIAGVDPVQFYRDHHARCSGFHLKDCQRVDSQQAYRTPPDPELMSPGVHRWFYEMGTGKGLVDYPKLMRAIVETGYDGWLTIEHDQAEYDGGSYAEATCVAKWYADRVMADALAGQPA